MHARPPDFGIESDLAPTKVYQLLRSPPIGDRDFASTWVSLLFYAYIHPIENCAFDRGSDHNLCSIHLLGFADGGIELCAAIKCTARQTK